MIDWPGIASLAREITATVLCAAASVFAIAGTVGVFRFSDPYTRLQASSLTGTTAVFTVLLASLALSPSIAVAARVVVIMVFFLISNPTATHIIARYAWKSGLEPATGPQKRGKRGKRRP